MSLKELFVGKKCLLTVADWFNGPDGKLYRYVWGTLHSIEKVDELLGFAPNRPNVNWVYHVGNMVINGCQVKHIIQCDNKPPDTPQENWSSSAADGIRFYSVPCTIYFTE